LTTDFHYNPLYESAQGQQVPWTPVELTDAALALDDAPRIVARLQGAEHGHAMLGRLAIGDRTALSESGIVCRRAYDTQAHEWGLGLHPASGVYYLVTGGPNMVAWGRPSVGGLVGIAHSHPRHAIDPVELTKNGLTPNVAVVLGEWVNGMYANMTISVMPGDLWALFPSNQDLMASYATAHPVPERVYLPWRIGPDGWLSNSTGPTLVVEFGPVRAALRPDAAKTARELVVDPKNDQAVKLAESRCLRYLYAPVSFRAGTAVLKTGFLQVDALKGTDRRDPQNAWFRAQLPAPETLLDRAGVERFIATAVNTH
jgi:hypothetical protein